MDIKQDAHHLGHADRRMRVVKLDRGLVGQVADMTERLDMSAHQVLQRRRNEEILLPQPQFLPGRRGVRRVQHLGDRLGLNLFGQRPGVVAVVERIQPKRIGGSSRPQPQRIDAPAAPSDGGRVVGHCLDGFRGVPDMAHRRF